MKLNNRDVYKIVENVVREMLQNANGTYTSVSDVIDLDKIPFSQLQQINIDLRDILYGFRFEGGVASDGNKLVINENVENKTEEPNNMKDELMGKFIFFDWQFIVTTTKNGIQLILVYADDGVNGDILCEKMKYMGWSKSYELKPKEKNGIVVRAIGFDPMYQEVIDDVKERWKVLYHLSPKYNEETIMKNGLVPSTRNEFFKYPPRIYMVTPNIPMSELEKLASNLNKFEKNTENGGVFTIYRIKTSMIPDNVELFYDPRFDYGVYSTKPIPTSAIVGKKYIMAKE